MNKTSLHSMRSIAVFLILIFIGLATLDGCKKSETNKQADNTKELSNRDDTADGSNGAESNETDPSLLQRTGGMIRKATDTSMNAAGTAGTWIQDKVQDSYESGKGATVNAGNAIREMFQQAKDKGTTTANNVVDFVKEDFAKLGSWRYAARTVTNESPNDVVTMLNQMGAEKWDCFWVDKQADQTTLYFKKTPRSYVNSIPFRDMIRYLPELGGGQ